MSLPLFPFVFLIRKFQKIELGFRITTEISLFGEFQSLKHRQSELYGQWKFSLSLLDFIHPDWMPSFIASNPFGHQWNVNQKRWQSAWSKAVL
jgi:hypothetical protein